MLKITFKSEKTTLRFISKTFFEGIDLLKFVTTATIYLYIEGWANAGFEQ